MQNTDIRLAALLCMLAGLTWSCGAPQGPKDPAPASGSAIDSATDAGAGASAAANPSDGTAVPGITASTTADAGSVDNAPNARGDIHVDDADDACQSAGMAFEKRARPQIKACYREAKKKDANLIGGVRLAVSITAAGKLGNIVSSANGDKKPLPPAVVKCMVAAVTATDPGDIALCKGKSLAIPVQFPSQ